MDRKYCPYNLDPVRFVLTSILSGPGIHSNTLAWAVGLIISRKAIYHVILPYLDYWHKQLRTQRPSLRLRIKQVQDEEGKRRKASSSRLSWARVCAMATTDSVLCPDLAECCVTRKTYGPNHCKCSLSIPIPLVRQAVPMSMHQSSSSLPLPLPVLAQPARLQWA